MRNFDKTIITCAITGGIHVPTMSPYLPITPDEIIDEAVKAAEAGASIVHIHVRDPETGEPVTDMDLFREVASGISSRCNAIVQPTTGGAPTMSVEERMKTVPELEPELASCNLGSFNFGLYPIAEKYESFEYDWEEEYLESTRDLIFPNTFADLEQAAKLFDETNTKPELECYDVGHLYNGYELVERGLIDKPIHIQFVLGIHGAIQARTEHLTHIIQTAERLFGDDYSFSVAAAGRNQFPMTTQAITQGGNARVGLEDNLYLKKGRLAESNKEQVEKITDLVHELSGSEIATPAETREFLELKGQNNTSF